MCPAEPGTEQVLKTKLAPLEGPRWSGSRLWKLCQASLGRETRHRIYHFGITFRGGYMVRPGQSRIAQRQAAGGSQRSVLKISNPHLWLVRLPFMLSRVPFKCLFVPYVGGMIHLGFEKSPCYESSYIPFHLENLYYTLRLFTMWEGGGSESPACFLRTHTSPPESSHYLAP